MVGVRVGVPASFHIWLPFPFRRVEHRTESAVHVQKAKGSLLIPFVRQIQRCLATRLYRREGQRRFALLSHPLTTSQLLLLILISAFYPPPSKLFSPSTLDISPTPSIFISAFLFPVCTPLTITLIVLVSATIPTHLHLPPISPHHLPTATITVNETFRAKSPRNPHRPLTRIETHISISEPNRDTRWPDALKPVHNRVTASGNLHRCSWGSDLVLVSSHGLRLWTWTCRRRRTAGGLGRGGKAEKGGKARYGGVDWTLYEDGTGLGAGVGDSWGSVYC